MTDSGWEQVPRERLGLSSCMLSNACKEAFQEEAGFALHPEKKITQADGSRRELPHRVRVGTGGRREPRGADASGMHIVEGDKQGPRRPLSSGLLTPRGRAERGGQRSPGQAGPLKSFYHHWVGSKVCGGSDRPLPASHFFFSFLLPRWLFPEVAFPRGPSWPAGRGHGSTTHPAAGVARP